MVGYALTPRPPRIRSVNKANMTPVAVDMWKMLPVSHISTALTTTYGYI